MFKPAFLSDLTKFRSFAWIKYNNFNVLISRQRLIKENVDLVDMRMASPLLRLQIYKYGCEVFLKEENYPAIFRAKSMQEYMDTLYLHEKRMETVINTRVDFFDLSADQTTLGTQIK